MNQASSGRRMPSDFHRRLDTHVVLAVTLVVAFALGAALLIATRIVTAGSLNRASSELMAAQSAFYQLEDDRAEFAAAQASLMTALPLFRANLTDSRVVNDLASMEVLADESRQQLNASFCIVTGRDGKWSGSSGWPGPPEAPPSIARLLAGAADGRRGRGVVGLDGRLFVAVSEPALFAKEVLGTLTVGYALDDAVAHRLAEVTHSEVNLVAGRRLAASSLAGDGRTAVAKLVAGGWPLSPGITARTEQVGQDQYVVGVFPLAPTEASTGDNRLVLLQNWGPAQRYLDQLQRQLFLAGDVIFVLALGGGLVFARGVSRPLTDMASAAADIAGGNWSRRVPVRGSAEATTLARAFNEMTIGLTHWYEEAKRRDDELRQAQKMEAIGRLAGGIAHDFNNLLTAITGNSELALLRLAPGHPVRKEVEDILETATRAAELTKQLLAFSRRQVVSPRILALDEVVAATARMLQRLLGEHVELIVSSQPDIARVRADRSQIEQLLLNLAVNARDAMPNGGTLRIGVANVLRDVAARDGSESGAPERFVCLSVADNGIGMDRDTAARIFEPFFTTKEAGRGTGLGLAIVYSVVERAGGSVDVETEPGAGTTFRVYFPQATDDAEPGREKARAEAGATPTITRAETVLLVQDNQQLGLLIGNMLRLTGYNVLEAANGEQALEIARTHSPIDLLVTDDAVRDMNGRVLSEYVRGSHPETRVLFTVGNADDPVLKHLVDAAIATSIQKPFSMSALMVKMQETLRSPGTTSGAR